MPTSLEQHHSEPEYKGIPIPSEHELSLISGDTTDNSMIGPHALGAWVVNKFPNIKEVLKHDIFHWIFNEATYSYSEKDEITEFAEGIDTGFSFFIGAITNIRYYRSGYRNVMEFISNTSASGNSIPLIGEFELERIMDVRRGFADIDLTVQTPFVSDSRDLASSHGSEYLSRSEGFCGLLEIEYEYIEHELVNKYDSGDCGIDHEPKDSEIDRLSTARIMGFQHGVDTAIEMYWQIDEQRVIAKLEQN